MKKKTSQENFQSKIPKSSFIKNSGLFIILTKLMLKPKINERLKNDLANSQIKKLDQLELRNRRQNSIFNSLFFGEKYLIAFIGSLIDFKNPPIRAFLERCERLEKKHPDWTLSQIVKEAEFGKGTGPKPKYELRPAEPIKKVKSKWGKLA